MLPNIKGFRSPVSMPLLFLSLHQKEVFEEMIIWTSNKDTN